MSRITQLCEALGKLIEDRSSGTERLPAGVSAKEIRVAESQMKVSFPDDLRELYAITNGTRRIWICSDGYLMPLVVPLDESPREQRLARQVLDCWQGFSEMYVDEGMNDRMSSSPTGPIKTDAWNPGWIPITYNLCGDHLCVDLDPPKDGVYGQVIQWDHETGAQDVVASSVADWLGRVVNDLESEKFTLEFPKRKQS